MAISEQQALALVDRVFKHITSQLMSSMSIKGLEKSGMDEFLPKFQEDIATAISVDNCINKDKMRRFLGLDNIDDLYLFLVYCKRFNEDLVLWDRYIDTYYPPFVPREGAVFNDKKFHEDGLNKMLNTTWLYLFYDLSFGNRNSFVPSSLAFSLKLTELKIIGHEIMNAALESANVFLSRCSTILTIVKKIEHVIFSMKPETAVSKKTTADSQNIFSLFGGIGSALFKVFSLPAVTGALAIQNHDKGPSPAA